MQQSELAELRKKYGEPVNCCRWCNQWKPYSKLYRSNTTTDGLGRFLGVITCNSCYHKFRKVVKDDVVVDKLFGWLEKNLHIKILVTYDEQEIVRGIVSLRGSSADQAGPSSSSPSETPPPRV